MVDGYTQTEFDFMPTIGGHKGQILALLRQGRATTDQLAAITYQYTARIDDLRKMGFDIRCVQVRPNGKSVWLLKDR